MAISSTLFSILLWGALLGVSLVFCYEVYAVAGHSAETVFEGRDS